MLSILSIEAIEEIYGESPARVGKLAKHLYVFLPASGYSVTSFPLAAAQAGVADTLRFKFGPVWMYIG